MRDYIQLIKLVTDNPHKCISGSPGAFTLKNFPK